MHAKDLLADLAQKAGLPSLALSEEGTAQLLVDGELALNIEHDDALGQLHLYTCLGAPPAENREAFYARLLEANLYSRETTGAVISLDAARQEILLTRSLELENTDSTSLELALRALIEAHERLSSSVCASFDSLPEDAPSSSQNEPNMDRLFNLRA